MGSRSAIDCPKTATTNDFHALATRPSSRGRYVGGAKTNERRRQGNKTEPVF